MKINDLIITDFVARVLK